MTLKNSEILLHLHPYGQYTVTEIGEAIGLPAEEEIYQLMNDGLVEPCEVWDSENDVSLGTSDKWCLTDAGREYVELYKSLSSAENESEVSYENSMLLAQIGELKANHAYALSLLEKRTEERDTLTQDVKRLKRLHRQYKELELTVGFCVKALDIGAHTTSSAEKMGQMIMIQRVLQDSLYSLDVGNDEIPF